MRQTPHHRRGAAWDTRGGRPPNRPHPPQGAAQVRRCVAARGYDARASAAQGSLSARCRWSRCSKIAGGRSASSCSSPDVPKGLVIGVAGGRSPLAGVAHASVDIVAARLASRFPAIELAPALVKLMRGLDPSAHNAGVFGGYQARGVAHYHAQQAIDFRGIAGSNQLGGMGIGIQPMGILPAQTDHQLVDGVDANAAAAVPAVEARAIQRKVIGGFFYSAQGAGVAIALPGGNIRPRAANPRLPRDEAVDAQRWGNCTNFLIFQFVSKLLRVADMHYFSGIRNTEAQDVGEPRVVVHASVLTDSQLDALPCLADIDPQIIKYQAIDLPYPH